jgi:ArsR family transcriptional regulator
MPAVTTTSLDPGVLHLLADPLRAQIVALLSVEQLCTCHLVEATGARQTNVSNHLRLLREAGVVEAEPHGRFTYYRLRPEPLDALQAAVADLADGARQALARKRPCA